MKFTIFLLCFIVLLATPIVADELPDQDFDGVVNHSDNCPNHANRFQSDFDKDGIGDACDKDSLANQQIPLIYEGIPSRPIAIQASSANRTGSCKFNNPIIQNISVPRLTDLDQYTINSLKFGFTAVHEFRGDLRVTIESPQGTRIKVIDDDGGGEYAAFDIYLDDSLPANQAIHNDITDNADLPFYERFAAPFKPLSGFNGESPFGIWKIEICDAFDIEDDGEFIGATLVFREGANTDNDSEDNFNDCAKLDPNRWKYQSVYLDEDGDGYGSGDAIKKCIGLKPPIQYSSTNDDNCPSISNQDQRDEDNDGIGDACDAEAFQVVKRAEIAKPILQKLYGKQYKPTAAIGNRFVDINVNDFHADWIEDFTSQKHNFSEGCSKNHYCPNLIITKDQLLAVFYQIKTSQNVNPTPDSFKEKTKNQLMSEVCGSEKYCQKEVVTVEMLENILNKLFPE